MDSPLAVPVHDGAELPLLAAHKQGAELRGGTSLHSNAPPLLWIKIISGFNVFYIVFKPSLSPIRDYLFCSFFLLSAENK